MADKAQEKTDASNGSKMTEEYVKGATPDELAERYNLTSAEVVEIVTKPVDSTPTILQSEIDEQDDKKGTK